MHAKTPIKNAKPVPPRGSELGTTDGEADRRRDLAKHGTGVVLRDRRAPCNFSIVVC